jgi:hypothetical protein
VRHKRRAKREVISEERVPKKELVLAPWMLDITPDNTIKCQCTSLMQRRQQQLLKQIKMGLVLSFHRVEQRRT